MVVYTEAAEEILDALCLESHSPLLKSEIAEILQKHFPVFPTIKGRLTIYGTDIVSGEKKVESVEVGEKIIIQIGDSE